LLVKWGCYDNNTFKESADSKAFIDVVIWKLRLPFSEVLRITIVVILPLGYSFLFVDRTGSHKRNSGTIFLIAG
jgi:hypothetical protein